MSKQQVSSTATNGSKKKKPTLILRMTVDHWTDMPHKRRHTSNFLMHKPGDVELRRVRNS